MSYYFCIACGDGPHNVSLNPYCPNCNVFQNHASQCHSHDRHTDSYTLNAHPHSPTPRSISTGANSGHGRGVLTSTSVHTAQFSGAPSYTAFATGRAPYTAPYSQRPERPPVYRWQCCKCGGDNSYKTDQGCANCCNHWRDNCCYVYDANANANAC